MGAQHTPGPWTWASNNWLTGGGTDWTSILEASDTGAPYGMHTPLIEHHYDADTAAANRSLIAAAPDMLAALTKARQFIENGIELGFIRMPDRSTPDSAHHTLPAIIAAITKATQP